jgi:hypothetical protein
LGVEKTKTLVPLLKAASSWLRSGPFSVNDQHVL